MMKKRMAWIGALSVAVLIGGVIGASTVQTTSANSGSKQEALIGVKKAKEAALKVVAGRVEDVDLEREGGRVYYEVEIETTKRVDYDVLIDAYSGATISSKLDEDDHNDDDRVATTSGTSVKPAEPTNGEGAITAQQAGKLAVAHTGGTIINIKSDRDDGQLIYEVKLSINGVKTEVEVDAVSGKILEVDKDTDDDDNDDLHDDKDDDDDDQDNNNDDLDDNNEQ